MEQEDWSVDFPGGLKEDLIELVRLQEGISFQADFYGLRAGISRERHVGELLGKAREIVNKYHPDTYGVSVGVPFGVQLSFTWKSRENQGLS